MPKYAELENNSYYSYYREKPQVYDYSAYANARYRQLRESNRPKRKKSKKVSVIHFLISLSIVLFLVFGIMNYSFNKITKSIFIPTPYASVKTDTMNLAFPTYNYLSNSWFMGERLFGVSSVGKKAKMVSLKENVNMPVLSQELLNLKQEYPSINLLKR